MLVAVAIALTLMVPIQATDSSAQQLLSRSRHMIAGGEPEKALELLLAHVEKVPTDKNAVLLIGESYYALKEFAKAVEFFERGLVDNGAQRQRAFNLGRSYELLGRFVEAESVFIPMMQAESIKLSSKGHFGMGLVFDAKSEGDNALRLYTKALELDANNHRAMYKIAQRYLKDGKPAEALAHCERILELRPLHHGAAYNMSLAYRRLGKTEEAVKAHQRWRTIKKGKERLSSLGGQLRQSPTNLKIVEAIADTHFELRQWKDAFEWFQRYLKARPGDARLLMKTGDTLRAAGQDQLASGVYRELVNRRPPVEAAVAPLIEVLGRLGQTEEIQQLRKQFPKAAPAPTSQPKAKPKPGD